MQKNGIQKANCLHMSEMTRSFEVCQMPGLVGSEKDYRKVKIRIR